MPKTQSDRDLLDAFVKSDDERAFRCLVQRYSGLIFHTALRSLNDRTLAEDVAQRVLAALAKKAARVARGSAPLPAWLHRTTILEAKSVRRTESRHLRKKEALMRAPSDSPASCDSAWKDALPHLDAAIDTLPEADRHILLLHFTNEMTFPEIARRVGKSAAAVQKQSRRALERLQQILGRKGIALSVGILTAGLTTEMTKASPVLLAPALGTLSGLGKTTTNVFIVKKTALTAISATVLLCGIPLARQQSTINRLESQLTTAATAPSESRVSAAPRGGTSPSLLVRLARDLKSKDFDMPRYLSAADYIEGLHDEELIALLNETVSSPMAHSNREAVFGKILDVLATRDPGFALDVLIDDVPLDYAESSEYARNILVNCLRQLSENDGSKALAWFHNRIESIRNISPMRGLPKESLEQDMRVALAFGLVFSAPSDAVEVLRPLPTQRLTSDLSQLVRSCEPSLRKDAAGFIQVVRQLLPEKEANEAVADLVQVNLTDDKFTSADVLLETYEFTPAETDAVFEKIGSWHFEPASRSPGGLEKAIPEYRGWLETRSVEGVDRRVGEALGKTAKAWSRTSEPIYQAMLKCRELGLGDDAILGLLQTSGFTLGTERSGPLAAMLSDPDAAREVLLKIQTDNTR